MRTGSLAGHLVVGPAKHGVVRFARDVITGLRGNGAAGPVVETTAAELRRDLHGVLAPLSGAPLVHVQYTDRLFGARCEQSAELFLAVSTALKHRRSRLSATLHDLPGAPTDDLARRRAAAYRRVASACVGLVVCSRHERARLVDFAGDLADVPPVRIVPLPIDSDSDRRPDPRPVTDVVVLGFLYPGKGHDEVLEAMAGLPPGITMTALGRPSDGHADLVAELQQLAGALRRSLRVSGFVPDRDLRSALRAAGVPVAPHRTVSASGSIATWLSAGRRPLVPDMAYTRELVERCPDALWLYGDGPGLVDALAAAVSHPERTWLGDVAVGPSTAQVASAYAAVLAGWS